MPERQSKHVHLPLLVLHGIPVPFSRLMDISARKQMLFRHILSHAAPCPQSAHGTGNGRENRSGRMCQCLNYICYDTTKLRAYDFLGACFGCPVEPMEKPQSTHDDYIPITHPSTPPEITNINPLQVFPKETHSCPSLFSTNRLKGGFKRMVLGGGLLCICSALLLMVDGARIK